MHKRSVTAVLAAVPLFLSVTAGVALADTVSNNLDASVDAVAEIMPLNVGSDGTTILTASATGGDGKPGCNFQKNTEFFTAAVSSSDSSVATVSPSTVTFGNCGDTQTLTVHAVSVGSTTVSLSQTANTTGGTFDLAPATFTVNVTAPAPANTAPTVTVVGPVDGASYVKGAVPTATCQVVDKEDGPSTFPATLSAVSGTYAADGIGQQTASCSYTDKGGLKAASSVTYSINDVSAPAVGYTLSPSAPNGTKGWYTSDVSLTWNVSEPDSPHSLIKIGCVDQSITTDQQATSYSCQASSVGGATTSGPVTIKRDATAPTVSYDGVTAGVEGHDGWYRSPVTVSFTATDALSGPSTQSQTVTSNVEGAAVVLPSPVFDDLAGNTTASGTVKSAALKIDSQAPNAPTFKLTPQPNAAGWNDGPVTVTFATAGDNGESGVASCTPAVTISTETADQTVRGTCTDDAGNTSPERVVTVRVDSTGPQVVSSKVIDGASGTNGWYKSDVTVRFTATDDLSGPSSQTADATSSGEGDAVEVASPSFTDAAGNTTPSGALTPTFKIDKSAPDAPTATLEPTPNADGWNNSPVTVDFTGHGDHGPSGLASCTEPIRVSTEGAAQEETGTCVDNAGNTSKPTTATVNLDMTPPAVSYDRVDGTPGAPGWYTSPVTVQFSATDGLSGVAGDKIKTVSVGDGQDLVVNSPAFADLAGNEAPAGTAHSDPLNIDTEPPNAPTYLLSPAPNEANWNNSPVIVHFIPTGDNGPSRVAGCTEDVTVSTEGTHTVTGTCIDNAGNVSDPTTVTVSLDKTGPSVRYDKVVSGRQGANDWYTSPVTVQFAASDALSGLDQDTQPMTSTTEGTGVVLDSPAFTDRAGNTTDAGAAHSPAFKIDTTAPTDIHFVGAIQDGGSYYYGAVPTAPTCTATDDVSGLTGCVVTGDANPGAAGTHTYTATATNGAGLTSKATLSYTVLSWTTKGFYAPVDMGGMWNTVKNGSTVPLKFEVFTDRELTDTSVVKSFTATAVTCPGSSAPVDPIEMTTTGGTSLRYDTTAGQFVQNWQTPKKPGACYKVTATMQDGSPISAYFSLK